MIEQPAPEPSSSASGGESGSAYQRSPTRPRVGSSADEALGVETTVVEERGRWAVDIIVVFADGVVRKRIDTHATKARAEISARLIKRAAERNLQGPLNG